MGHRDMDMIIRVYSKFVKNASGAMDGKMLNAAYAFAMDSHGEEQVE